VGRASTPEIQSSFLDDKRRRWSFAYLKDQAHISLADFREVQVAGQTIDDPVHLLTAYAKAQTLCRIATEDPASDWLWACLRATRDLRKASKNGHKEAAITTRQPGVIRRKKTSKKGYRKG
jgi:hypothetical protein